MNRTFVFRNGTKIIFEPIAANPDIAGIGVFLSFTITSILTIFMGFAAYVIDLLNAQPFAFSRVVVSNMKHGQTDWKAIQQGVLRFLNPKSTSSMTTAVNTRYGQTHRRIIERVILGFSDQQLVVSFALLIGKMSDPVLSHYHKKNFGQ